MSKKGRSAARKAKGTKLAWIQQTLQALRFAVPIIKADTERKKAIELLGTGFFVASADAKCSPVIITAKHVLTGHISNSHEAYCAIRLGLEPDYPNYYFYESEVCYSKTTDLAAFKWPDPPDPAPLPLVRNRISTSDDVVMVEFSRTTVAGASTQFHYVMHKGNVMCYYPSGFPPIENTPAFDTSFPALQGASGAPVVALRPGFPVVGSIVCNIENQPLPAQTIRIGDGEEETSYFLPTGHALAAEVIVDFLSSIDFDPLVI